MVVKIPLHRSLCAVIPVSDACWIKGFIIVCFDLEEATVVEDFDTEMLRFIGSGHLGRFDFSDPSLILIGDEEFI